MNKYLSRIKDLYHGMDEAYASVAREYDFSCGGCGENCCTQRFHHHTLAEYIYLMEGLRLADDERIEKILRRARVAVGTYMAEVHAGEILPVMCPVNEGGLCALYEWRPMICRMHGLPHSFRRPDGGLVEAGGCNNFSLQAKKSAVPLSLDRTPFYKELASIEKELRAELNFRGRYAKTTAEMLIDMEAAMSSKEL